MAPGEHTQVPAILGSVPLSKAMRTWLAAECSDQDWDEQTFVERLDSRWPKLTSRFRTR